MKPLSMMLALLTLAGCGAAPASVSLRPVSVPAPAVQAASAPEGRPLEAAPAPAATFAAPRMAAEAQSVTLDLLTFNTWGKPGLLGTDEKRRMGLIGPAIRGHDVVALQETFTRHAATMGKLSGYPHQDWVKNGGWFKMKSGLYTLSVHPILETDFAPFKEAADWDRFARKGVSFTRLSVPGLGPVDVYNTHYQAVSKYSEIRKHDNAVLESLVKRHDAGYPTFLMGDFNMKPGSPEHADLMARLPLRDAFGEHRPGEDGFTSAPDNVHKADDKAGKRIDYVFILKNRHDVVIESAEVAMTALVDGTHLSDHYGVRARVRVTPRAN